MFNIHNIGNIGNKGFILSFLLNSILPRVRNQVSLELSQVNIQSSVKPERSSDGRNNLAYQTVEIGVGWSLDVKVAATDVVDSLVINHECAV